MDKELKEKLVSIFTLENFITLVKAAIITAACFLIIEISLFWITALGAQFGLERKNMIETFGSKVSSDSTYFCQIEKNELCTKKELIAENIMIAKLAIKNYFYLAYIPDRKINNLDLIFMNALLVTTFFVKIHKKNKSVQL